MLIVYITALNARLSWYSIRLSTALNIEMIRNENLKLTISKIRMSVFTLLTTYWDYNYFKHFLICIKNVSYFLHLFPHVPYTHKFEEKIEKKNFFPKNTLFCLKSSEWNCFDYCKASSFRAYGSTDT